MLIKSPPPTPHPRPTPFQGNVGHVWAWPVPIFNAGDPLRSSPVNALDDVTPYTLLELGTASLTSLLRDDDLLGGTRTASVASSLSICMHVQRYYHIIACRVVFLS